MKFLRTLGMARRVREVKSIGLSDESYGCKQIECTLKNVIVVSKVAIPAIQRQTKSRNDYSYDDEG